MQRIGLWHITQDGPRKLEAVRVDLEQYLEDWIARDPSLLQQGLVIVGRQIGLEGGRLDLLGLDPQGRWAVIEIKSGRVRRETIAQALDYASCIARMPQDELYQKAKAYLQNCGTSLEALLEERGGQDSDDSEGRDVVMYVVGTGSEPGLERMVDYLSETYDMPITLVSYEVFEIGGQQQILVRELTDLETSPPARSARPGPTVEDICAQAEQAGIGREFRMILDVASKHNLYPRPYKRSIMYTPPSNRTRTLFTVWATPGAGRLLWVYIGPQAFAEFYPVTEECVTSLIGAGWQKMTGADVETFVANLDRLFESLARTDERNGD